MDVLLAILRFFFPSSYFFQGLHKFGLVHVSLAQEWVNGSSWRILMHIFCSCLVSLVELLLKHLATLANLPLHIKENIREQTEVKSQNTVLLKMLEQILLETEVCSLTNKICTQSRSVLVMQRDFVDSAVYYIQ